MPGRQGEVRIWSTESWSEVKVLRGHADTILALAWRPGKNQLATASLDKLILVWDVDSGKVVRTIKSHADIVHGAGVQPRRREARLGLGRQDGQGLRRRDRACSSRASRTIKTPCSRSRSAPTA